MPVLREAAWVEQLNVVKQFEAHQLKQHKSIIE